MTPFRKTRSLIAPAHRMAAAESALACNCVAASKQDEPPFVAAETLNTFASGVRQRTDCPDGKQIIAATIDDPIR